MIPTILVLEDDDTMREALVDVLEDHCYIVQGACQADEAIEWSEKLPFHLAISDVRMAGRLDGLGAMEILHRRNPDLACIIITGYADADAPARAARIRVDDYLYKPFRLDAVLQTVRRVLDKSRQRSDYAKVLRRLLTTSQQILEGRRRDESSQRLEELRDRVLSAYYVLIRARDTRLTRSLARDLWDQIEDLDIQYLRIAHHLTQISLTLLQNMAGDYQRLLDGLTSSFESSELGSLKARGPEQVDRVAFNRFFEGIESGRIGPEEVKVAAAVRRLHPSRRDGDWEKLHRLLWEGV